MKKIFIYIIVAITLLFAATSLSAAIITWDGDGSNNRWNNKNNWVSNVIPKNNDSLVFASVANPIQSTANNNISNLILNSITFNTTLTRNLTISGNSIQITNGIFNYNKTNTMTVSNGIIFNGSNIFLISEGTMNLTGALSGSSPITKDGTGILNVSRSNNTMSGPITISNGIVNVNATRALGTSSIILNNGTLFFSGSSSTNYNNAITVNNGLVAGSGRLGNMLIGGNGTVSPGNSSNNIGNLTSTNLTFSGTGNYNWQIYNATGSRGSGYDILNAATLNLSSATAFNINLWSMSSTTTSGNTINFNNANNYTWTLVATTGGIVGFDPTKFIINVNPNNGTNGFTNPLGPNSYFTVSVAGNNLNLNYMAVPEPATIALLIVGGIFMILRRKISKKCL